MPRLKRLSGHDIVRILEGFGFVIASQRGSHIKLKRITKNCENQVLTIPNHETLDLGTCKAILRQASRYVPIEELESHFYHN